MTINERAPRSTLDALRVGTTITACGRMVGDPDIVGRVVAVCDHPYVVVHVVTEDGSHHLVEASTIRSVDVVR